MYREWRMEKNQKKVIEKVNKDIDIYAGGFFHDATIKSGSHQYYNSMSKDTLRKAINSLTDRLYWLVAFEKYVKEMNPGLYVKATNYVDEEGRELTYREIKEREYNNE
tara:strand:+ start:327 stop:650 length:324 start_codon:yes stop_codon:yes gene_type:complete